MILSEKSATFPAHALGAVSEELRCMEGGGQSWRRPSNRADDLHNPRNRHALCVLVDVRPRVLPPLWRGPRRPWTPKRQGLSATTFVGNPALAGWEAGAVRRS